MADPFPHDSEAAAQYRADIIRFTEGLRKIRRDDAALAAGMVEAAASRAIELVGFRRASLMFVRILQEIWRHEQKQKGSRAASKAPS